MPTFTIVYKDESTKNFEAASKEDLIRDFSLEDATAFQNDVKEIHWDEKECFCVENISSGEIIKTAFIKNEK
ncbi:hypothetical protein QYS49_33880 [Marivirga salinae]|uniref:Uncharacterized protein n=1 Tax=Marivirga salinarum TaxID=3059078 RepID=A0AA51NCD5_9BACT|nr:hypothetical protein [Marivirga sp. BDSF4-3]WMN12533.1 hypothetical protein QYS49_33880 [Marivirga sp. BDSF4-3]